ncbi:MAG TPA: hypothetical protein VH418_12020 [Solirubrobacteraceae bacterium]|jgi:hypothetical protein
MSLASDAERPGRFTRTPPPRVPVRTPQPNTISASQARAARQREARRDEQAVAAWLRELSARPR